MCAAELPRIGELRAYSIALASPDAYFQPGDTKFSDPAKRRFFADTEADLHSLDAEAWAALKAEALPRITANAPGRGHAELFAILNQARAYNHLTAIGCAGVRFVPGSNGKTPDLAATLGNVAVLCEVKTINVSEREVERRQSGGVGTSQGRVEPGFLAKLRSDIGRASTQMSAFDPDPAARRIVYVVVNFDDLLHEYGPECRAHIEAELAASPPAGVEVVLDIKPPFYWATRAA